MFDIGTTSGLIWILLLGDSCAHIVIETMSQIYLFELLNFQVVSQTKVLRTERIFAMECSERCFFFLKKISTFNDEFISMHCQKLFILTWTAY